MQQKTKLFTYYNSRSCTQFYFQCS